MKRVWEVLYGDEIVHTARSYKACKAYLEKSCLEDPICDPYGDDFTDDYIVGTITYPEHKLIICKIDERDRVIMTYNVEDVTLKITYLKNHYRFRIALKDRYTVKSFKCAENGGWYQYATQKYLFEVSEIIQEDLDLPYKVRNIIEKDFKKFLTKDMDYWFRH